MKTVLTFKPIYKDYIWGGRKIAAQYRRRNVPERCAESWEISGRSEAPSIVASGEFEGRGLDELAAEFGEELTGTAAQNPAKFPLLFKLIDANDPLSLQVHPSNTNAAKNGGEPKTEMWYVLGAAPGACLYAGLNADANEEWLLKSIEQGRASALLNRYQIALGQAFYIPGGMVHAIGKGCLIYEIQQSSDTTYRIYDWDRRTPDGKPARELHLTKGMKTIDWSLPPPKPRQTGSIASDATIVTCRHFCFSKMFLREHREEKLDGRSFHAFFVEKGKMRISCGDAVCELPAGASCLVPAGAESYDLDPVTQTAVILRTTLCP